MTSKHKHLVSDIKFLSFQWEYLLESLEYPSRTIAMRMLHSLITSYMRGQGCRMGNWQGIQKHKDLCAAYLTMVLDRIYDESDPAVMYPKIHALGLTERTEAMNFFHQQQEERERQLKGG